MMLKYIDISHKFIKIPVALQAFQHLEVSQSFQIPLCDGNAGVSHQARQAVQVQSVLQLHLQDVWEDANLPPPFKLKAGRKKWRE